ncbi:MAG: hypothetical protein UW41_C0029G0004 [Candidatus Collierbacteria bacterium GW2011_GWC2_44_18]|uniref:DUF7919 domain-containing protein n=1 Tax=Candidatus Collierbacteria bacterium GW2011_GWC2_44_18 TaxID=1618392 RepID=A0A0G1JWY4_9BACT|nr:MAG: hypothetical protein UW16_C0018G0005 [Microgenomates group bacterium GW2011_GWC1_44_10]KKT48437.1 MAG: hypothetical protein UW41_C0029G0004 [Candidatus Collierbacteria bacterium GW2011_GWC2_44_18]
MGWHDCEYLHTGTLKYGTKSSGDVTLVFANDHAWVMPDMILHYVADHSWAPPVAFVHDVMAVECTGSERRQTRGRPEIRPVPVGYLSGSFQTGSAPAGFLEKLEALMKKVGSDYTLTLVKPKAPQDKVWR